MQYLFGERMLFLCGDSQWMQQVQQVQWLKPYIYPDLSIRSFMLYHQAIAPPSEILHQLYLSRLMRKPTICICENKDADQLRGNREADQRLCFRYRIVHFLAFLNPKFQASSSFLCLYRPVCVRPGRKPHCWFSHEAADLYVFSY